jgi:hypothetical protein
MITRLDKLTELMESLKADLGSQHPSVKRLTTDIEDVKRSMQRREDEEETRQFLVGILPKEASNSADPSRSEEEATELEYEDDRGHALRRYRVPRSKDPSKAPSSAPADISTPTEKPSD